MSFSKQLIVAVSPHYLDTFAIFTCLVNVAAAASDDDDDDDDDDDADELDSDDVKRTFDYR